MLIQDFLQEWNLGSDLRIHEIPHGAVNRVFRLETPDENFFLRVYKSEDPATLLREHALIDCVVAQGIPAARPIEAKSGSRFVVKNQKIAALYYEAKGQQIPRTRLQSFHAEAAGKMLAQIHRATQNFPNHGYRVYNLSWDLETWIEKLNKIETLISARLQRTESDHWALSRLKEQRRWLQNSFCSHYYVPQGPSQVLHGDFHDGNLFFGKEEVSGVIDWDQSTYMPRAFEVVRAASYMFGLDPEPTQAFIAAYREIFPLSESELEDGAQGWGRRSDHYVWAVEEVYIHGNERARVFIPHRPFLPFQEMWAKIRSSP